MLVDEGLSARLDYRDVRAPGRYHSHRSQWFVGAVALSPSGLLVAGYRRRLLHMPFDDGPGVTPLEVSVPREDRLRIRWDPGAYAPDWSGTLTLTLHTHRARELAIALYAHGASEPSE